ncbi:MAG: hypothetical protein DWQ06_10135 [Calditrichaeota bacterium]|nr:MAG: hypothetical protein DWQ06_10135 [Calditrichota bacterium]
MQKIFLLIFFVCFLSCSIEESYNENLDGNPKSEMVFDKAKWQIKEGNDYLYRDKMVNDIVYNYTIRTLDKNKILALLGEPSYYRENKNFLYYLITEKSLGPWTLHTKTMVIKLLENNSVDWIKIHE